MGAQQSWQCQGRQYHGWFGSGTCAENHGQDACADAADAEQARHILAVLYGVVGNLPVPQRQRWEAWLQRGNATRFATLLTTWASSAHDADDLATRFLPDGTGDRTAAALHDAATAAAAARDAAGEAAASTRLAAAVQAVGLDRWARFVGAAEDKAAAVPAPAPQARVIPVQEPFIEEVIPRLFAKPPEEVIPRNMVRIPEQSGKEASTEIPSWAKGKPRRVGETPREFAKRLMDEHYGKGTWREKANPDFQKIKKFGSRAWQDPRVVAPVANAAPQA